MPALIVTVTCEDAGPTLGTERRDEILSAFVGAGRKLGLDGIHVSVDAPPSERAQESATQRFYEQAAWDKRHGRV